jgi:hypothetical protein
LSEDKQAALANVFPESINLSQSFSPNPSRFCREMPFLNNPKTRPALKLSPAPMVLTGVIAATEYSFSNVAVFSKIYFSPLVTTKLAQ